MLISFDPFLETVETAACLESSIQTANTGFWDNRLEGRKSKYRCSDIRLHSGKCVHRAQLAVFRFYSGVTTKLSAAISFLCLGHSAVLQS